MHRFSCSPLALSRACCLLLLGALLACLPACDTSGPDPSLESEFDMTVGDPVNTSLKGTAALGSDLSFDQQSVFTLPVPPLGKTVSIIQLSGDGRQDVVHDLSFMRIADGPIAEGTYELGRLCENGCRPFPPEELLTADYGRQTADSLHSWTIDAGTITVETATEEGVEGSFSLTASQEISVSRSDLQAFLDSLRSMPVPDRPFRGDTTAFPTPPPTDIRVLETPMTIEGRFTATPGTPLSPRVPHLSGFDFGGFRFGGDASRPAP